LAGVIAAGALQLSEYPGAGAGAEHQADNKWAHETMIAKWRLKPLEKNRLIEIRLAD
jgi:hypothetical protein